MRKILFTFNFNKRQPALLWAIIAVIVIETVLSKLVVLLPFTNTTDRTLYDIEHKRYDADIVFISDSVGRQILKSALSNYGDGNYKFAMLLSNGAVEMTGRYFLIERYLKRNKKPKAVVFVGVNPLGGNLKGRYTENYVQRCFLKPDEILQLTLFKGIKFGLVMVIYKLFPSYRYRWTFQKKLFGSINTEIDPEKFEKEIGNPVSNGNANFVKMAKRAYKETWYYKMTHKVPISDRYFNKLLSMLRRDSIEFFLVCAPMSEFYAKKRNVNGMYDYFNELTGKYNNFHVLNSFGLYQEKYFIPDKLHLTDEGLLLTHRLMQDNIDAIKNTLSLKHQDQIK